MNTDETNNSSCSIGDKSFGWNVGVSTSCVSEVNILLLSHVVRWIMWSCDFDGKGILVWNMAGGYLIPRVAWV